MTEPLPEIDGATPFSEAAIARRLLTYGNVLFTALTDDGTIAWISGSSGFLLGVPPVELIGRNVLEFLHVDDHQIALEIMTEPARGSEDRIRVGLRLRHADGSWVSLEFGGIDLREPDGSGLFLIWGSPYEATSQLLTFLNALLAGAPLDDLLGRVARWHDSTMPGTHSAILLLDPDGAYRSRAHSPVLPVALAVGLSAVGADDATTPWRLAAANGTTAECTDIGLLPVALAAAAQDRGYQAVWAVPVVVPNRRHPAAILVSWRLRPGPLLATQRRQTDNTTQILRLAIEWSTAQELLVVAATTDSLTGLANRSQLEARMATDQSPLAAVLFVDLDSFKIVNDEHGHQIGDRILIEAARRMEAAVRPTDLLVRLGGDEFAVWCSDLADVGQAELVADRLVAAMEVPIEVDGHAHQLGVSIGLAAVAADDPLAGDLTHLLTAADRALYRAKRAGKGQWMTEPTLPFS